MKRITQISFILLVIISAFSFAKAQNTISEEKRKLIAELIILTNVEKNVVGMTDTILQSMETTYPIAFQRALENNPNLTKKERDRLAATMKESYQSFSKRFRERLPQSVNYAQYIEEAVYPLYDKFFNEKEIGDLVAFYKTDTGRKVIDTMPQVFAESTRLSRELLLPKILKVVDELMQEDLERLSKPPKTAGE
jgi:hypothetical protein